MKIFRKIFLKIKIGSERIEVLLLSSRQELKFLMMRKIINAVSLTPEQVAKREELRKLNYCEVDPGTIDSIVISTIGDDIGEIPYRIKIGDWIFKEIYDANYGYCNYPEDQRIELEHLTVAKEGSFTLYWDDYPTTFIVEQLRLTMKVAKQSRFEIDKHGRKRYKKKEQTPKYLPQEYALLTILTPDYGNKSDEPYIGIVPYEELISELYQAILGASLRWSLFNGDHFDVDDLESGWVFYNKLKSPVVEQYLYFERPGRSECAIRQVDINHLLVLGATNQYAFITEGKWHGIPENDKITIENSGGTIQLEIPGISQWYDCWLNRADNETFDYESWNKTGIALAKKIRAMLPDEYDVWYSYSREDPGNPQVWKETYDDGVHLRHPRLIPKQYPPRIKW